MKEGTVRGTIVCGVTDGDEGHAALERGVELSQRLGLRLVLAHVAEGFAPLDGQGEDNESVTTKGSRRGGEVLLARLAREHGVIDTAELRVAVGEPASLVGQIAAEEAADVIVVGSRARDVRSRARARDSLPLVVSGAQIQAGSLPLSKQVAEPIPRPWS